MKKKIIGILVCMLLVSTATSSLILTANAYKLPVLKETTKGEIFKEIEQTEGKDLILDEIIGDRQVKYWGHTVDGILVKNDYILLHMDIGNGEVLKYEKSWTGIELSINGYADEIFEVDDFFWKQLVVFPKKDDCRNFYSFDDIQEYPLVCQEVRHTDGTTIVYDVDGEQIGQGIPAPSTGFSLSGYNDAGSPDPWIEYRENADFWFAKWCTPTVSLSMPTPSTISSHISDSTVEYFYELAHGDEHYFQAEAAGSNYYATTLEQDMANRQPMRFAFIGSCQGMTSTGPGTFSYEFRKGEMTGTVTVGFDHMETCPGWEYAYYWQDSMFENMSKGLTVKESFDMATARFPTIEPAVVFLGDATVKANQPPEKPAKPSGSASGEAGVMYEYACSAADPEQDQVFYLFDWGDGSDSGWVGPYGSGYEGSASHSWSEQGDYEIKVKAKDDPNGDGDCSDGTESVWSDPLSVAMPKNKAVNGPFFSFLENHPEVFPLLRQLVQRLGL